ncbi:glycosyltransferase family 4 protein [Candidatus Berkelbacteria bacterium CG_4_8_14_3_um_filter_33_6]|uniref:Glycosyltransferase family 4 protein n=1 Tax=Candidatus Berkelbacteria bacterium CG_4_10_14_0_2_um_filter_35_9_33_12 TaxID=1974499 RepID=A0A2M7W4I7_9BACT|nr:MAG: glycosyl transferase [Candidatus Berkelbacteria bacterium CG23_combo_of_CG06-09_8_20_14_all_33_15]PIS08143.1 MAG: glycosyltransferase family 4 protein [Candidatus Berkelbacteria bacterium CG10_big_fil_rev_8_21_14_0_10_33_10]PIX30959.1 MAG: glycosyltransferase family 4 protein [Candidatus Berkelbacteria bacterium CG_4_8_14_3_um_filter_33_6]PJA20740.1 MAG: glycosyltransferase family 4 protein [Candidatus Berkelbacteria bacterium CG_4_10_14_0_2_um_filter_35_9_33_12]
MNIKKLKVAIVTESLTQFGGAEIVLKKMLQMFPNSTLFTPLYNKILTDKHFPGIKIETSFLQYKYKIHKYHRFFLGQLPNAFESFNFSGFDLVISNTSAFSKGVNVPKHIPFIAYVHSPTRYLWSDFNSYVNENIPKLFKPFKSIIIKQLLRLRNWDLKASKNGDLMLGNSQHIVNRIKKYYQREAYILYPFADTKSFNIDKKIEKEDFYFMSGRLVPYKKIDIAIRAFNLMPDKKLFIAGSGNQYGKLKKLIKSKNIRLLGRIGLKELVQYYQRAKGYIFTPLEDFGITPIEAMACGTPVIAYEKGGALETVTKNISGVFFEKQTEKSLIDALNKFEKMNFNQENIRLSVVNKFSPLNFENSMLKYVERVFKLKKGEKYA